MLPRSLMFVLAGVLTFLSGTMATLAAPETLISSLEIRHLMDPGGNAFRIVKDPTANELYYLKLTGEIFRLLESDIEGQSSGESVFSSADHGVTLAAGLAIGPSGIFYVVGNATTDDDGIITMDGDYNVASIVKGEPEPGGILWSTLAKTEPYPLSHFFDHLFNAVVVSPDGQFVYVNSGARTDHGEESSAGGLFPGTREVPLTTSIFRLPAQGQDILLTNSRTELLANGYLFAEGLRNTFDMAFAPNGDLFGAENGPDRDMSEELNWLREGNHYGFPWRMGVEDNPQQFPGYDPDQDLLLNDAYGAVREGLYEDDPNFPPLPALSFTDPVINLGPDADKFRDPDTGEVLDASDLDLTLSTFTAHRSPLGLVFDVDKVLGGKFKGDGFMLSFQRGVPGESGLAGPFDDPSEDLVHIELKKLKRGQTNYEATVTRIVGGFTRPVAAEIMGNHIYVLEFARSGQNQAIWKISLPASNSVRRGRRN